MSPLPLSAPSPTLNSTRPRSHTASTFDDFEGQLQHQEDASASSFKGKPRATSSSFHGSSFHYSSFRPLFDDSDDEEDDQEDQAQCRLPTSPPPPAKQTSIEAATSSAQQPSSLSPSLSSPLPNESQQTPVPFHNESFNYQSFKPLFDDSDGDDEEGGLVEGANNRGRKASVEEGFEAVTPDLLPERTAKEVEEGLRLDAGGVGKEKGVLDGWKQLGEVEERVETGGDGRVVV
ncbi:hypothetical protein BDY24DRAFT_419415 [Mrakia frigida]|uniref:uncharacterized protein n=1 Tax=Mrakia frigida TaxID=29902 RepID=UPI003FCC0E9F